MRILILTNLYPPFYQGGFELKCKLHADELMKRGHELIILTSRWKIDKAEHAGNIYRVLELDPLSRLVFNQKGKRLPLSPLERRVKQLMWAYVSRNNYLRTKRIIHSAKPDIAYIWGMGGIYFGPILAVHRYKLPVVYRIDDYWLATCVKELFFETNFIKRTYRSFIEGVRSIEDLDINHALFVSEWVQQAYSQNGLKVRYSEVLPEGVLSKTVIENCELEKKVGLKPKANKKTKLLYVGRLDQEKGAHIAIESLRYLKESGFENVCLDIFGAGPAEYLVKLRTLVDQYSLGEHVNFRGFIDHQELQAKFKNYDVALVPSLWEEPLSGTIAETMSQGLVVIASDRGGNSEIIKNEENGLLVPANDPPALAHALKRLILDPDFYNLLCRNGLRTVREKFINEKIVDKVEAYLVNVKMKSEHLETP